MNPQKRARRQRKAIICTYYDLAWALNPVHMFNKADMNRLHDVWKMGAPVPSSRIMQPKIYDPRIPQQHLGNVEKRIILRKPLAEWTQDVLQRNGKDITLDDAAMLVNAVSSAWG